MSLSPSALAMERYIARSPGLSQPQLSVRVPGTPTLPDLKVLAVERRAAGFAVVDQSAGDISEVGEPLSEEFVQWIPEARERLLREGHGGFAHTRGAFGFPDNYAPQYQVVVDKLAESWGIHRTPFVGVQTVSGRAALDQALHGLVAWAEERGLKGRKALILDPLAWSGYAPLAEPLGLSIIHAPAEQELAMSPNGLRAAISFARGRGLEPIGAIPIIPSNPTGAGVGRDSIKEIVEAAAAEQLPVMIDAFYSPLAPEGHDQAVPLAWLEEQLAPEALSHLGLVVGETKVTSSQNKTATVLWMTPDGHDKPGRVILGVANKRKRATNCYPRPQEALVAYALHTFPAGVHAAMGPRYRALDATRTAMRTVCDELGLPLSIGGSFYGSVALVDESGESLIRTEDGSPIDDLRVACETLIQRYGLVGAPGSMFSPAPEARSMLRLTAAVTLDEVARVKAIFGQMIEEAKR